MPQNTHGDQSKTLYNQFSPSFFTWVLGIELRVYTKGLPTELSSQPLD